MSLASTGKQILRAFRARPTLRAGSLIITVFGDSIAPRGGKVWLGSLIRVLDGFGINERRIRTSVFRLARDGWLQSEQIGRRSYYGLTAEGRERFEQATHRIYEDPAVDWDGNWCLLLLSALETGQKEAVRKECGWLGFGAMSANVLAHPSPDIAELETSLRRLNCADSIVVLNGRTLRNEAAMRQLAHASWNIAALAQRYDEFVRLFRPLQAATARAEAIPEELAFSLRSALIHEYRSVLLRDPLLPTELLPDDWQGGAAYRLCRNLYVELHEAADRYLDRAMETAEGPLPPPSGAFWKRFGGLRRVRRAS